MPTSDESDGYSKGCRGAKPAVGASSDGSGNNSNGHGGDGEEIGMVEEEEQPLQPTKWLQH